MNYAKVAGLSALTCAAIVICNAAFAADSRRAHENFRSTETDVVNQIPNAQRNLDATRRDLDRGINGVARDLERHLDRSYDNLRDAMRGDVVEREYGFRDLDRYYNPALERNLDSFRTTQNRFDSRWDTGSLFNEYRRNEDLERLYDRRDQDLREYRDRRQDILQERNRYSANSTDYRRLTDDLDRLEREHANDLRRYEGMFHRSIIND